MSAVSCQPERKQETKWSWLCTLQQLTSFSSIVPSLVGSSFSRLPKFNQKILKAHQSKPDLDRYKANHVSNWNFLQQKFYVIYERISNAFLDWPLFSILGPALGSLCKTSVIWIGSGVSVALSTTAWYSSRNAFKFGLT